MVCDISDIFSRSFVMSVDNARLGRFHRVMESAFGNSGFYVPPRFVQANVNLDFKLRCTRTHIDIIEHARDMKLPSVMIFEDDALPRPDAAECMRHHLSNLPDDCAVFQMGSTIRLEVAPDKVNGLLRVRRVLGSQAYIIFANAYDAFINRFYHGPFVLFDEYFGRVATTYIPEYDIFIQYDPAKRMNGGYYSNEPVVGGYAPMGFLSPFHLKVLGFPQAFPPEWVKQARDRLERIKSDSVAVDSGAAAKPEPAS